MRLSDSATLSKSETPKTTIGLVKLYNATLSLAQIEANVPQMYYFNLFRRTWSNTYSFANFEVLQRKIMGPRQIENKPCHVQSSSKLTTDSRKTGGVKWAERQLQQVSSHDGSEYKRLVHGWHLALHKAEMGEVAHTRRLKIEKNEQHAKKTKNAKLTENGIRKR